MDYEDEKMTGEGTRPRAASIFGDMFCWVRGESARRIAALSCVTLGLGILLLLSTAQASAHQTDTSYARVRIFPDRLEIRLTCDIFTLQKIVPDLDANQDSGLSREELRNATPAIQEFLRNHVAIEIDGGATNLGTAKDPFWPLDAPDPVPAGSWHTNEALVKFGFDKALSQPPRTIALIFDVFSTLAERHSVLGVFEVQGHTTEVLFTSGEPDFLFDVEYAHSSAQGSSPKAALESLPEEPGNRAGLRRSGMDDSPLWRFFKMGISHILTGYDHLCFLLALLVVSRLRPLIAIVTSFTVAHSITLLLAAFGFVSLPTRLIECAIALTIVYVAVENVVCSDLAQRWRLTFAFGLIHGFGFANTLDPHELPAQAKAKCLVAFNLGVEIGQLAVVLALLPLSIFLARSRYGRAGKILISTIVALLGSAWFLDRVFKLEWMPF